MVEFASNTGQLTEWPGRALHGTPDAAAMALLGELSRLLARPLESQERDYRVAIILRLSRLMPPAPRPHHRRVARALMQDTASWYGGQVFSLVDGDLVLLCQPRRAAGGAAISASTRAVEPEALPDMLRQLLRVDTPPGFDPVTVWPLATHGQALHDDIRARVVQQEGRRVMEEEYAGQTEVMDVLGSFISSAAIADLLQRQTAVLLRGGGEGRGGLLPIYQEITFSIAALEGRVASAASASTDPFLFRHLATRLDLRILDILTQAAGMGGPLDVTRQDVPALHINLTVQGILTADFARLAAVAGAQPGRAAPRVAVEVNLLDAVADFSAFERARAVLAESGFAFVLENVSHLSLMLTRPGVFDAALVKLDWSPRLAEFSGAERATLHAALREIGLERVVLHRAETEAALRWGVASGIRRFQGRHVDAMLGAARIVGCGFAKGCTLRHCIERAGATNALGRADCLNLALLDAAVPQGSALSTSVRSEAIL